MKKVFMVLICCLVIGLFVLYFAVSPRETDSEAAASGGAASAAPSETVSSTSDDTEPPVITLAGDAILTLTAGDTYTEPGYTCRDSLDGDLTASVTVTGQVDTSAAGKYELTYRVTDAAGNTAEAVRTVKVKNPEGTPVDRTVRGLPILMYHFFYDTAAGETGRDGNWMEISDFEAQMAYLAENDYYFPTWDEVADFVDGVITLPEKSVVVTSDDGNESFFRLAIPVLEKYDILATSFIVGCEVETATVKAVTATNIQFRSHTYDMHRAGSDGNGRFLTVSYEEAVADFEAGDEALAGIRQVFCYPYGHYNDFTKQVLTDMGFDLAVTIVYDRVYPNMEKLELPRIRMSADTSLASFISSVS